MARFSRTFADRDLERERIIVTRLLNVNEVFSFRRSYSHDELMYHLFSRAQGALARFWGRRAIASADRSPNWRKRRYAS